MIYSTGKGSAAPTCTHYRNGAPVSHSGGQSGQNKRLAIVVVITVNHMRIDGWEANKRRNSSVKLTGETNTGIRADLSHNRRNASLSVTLIRTGERVVIPVVKNYRTGGGRVKSCGPLYYCTLHLIGRGGLHLYYLSVGVDRFVNVPRHIISYILLG
jgi:hypothetical protein